MAPQFREDDFILTISDDDGLPLEELEDGVGSASDFPVKSAQNRLKRKRNVEPLVNDTLHVHKANKKQKRTQNTQANRYASCQEAQEVLSGQGSIAQEDEGSMNSDFEFQNGDGDIADLEDFDGWGLGNKDFKGGHNKGVDIDELIARRQNRKIAAEDIESSKGSHQENDGDMSGDIGSSSKEENGTQSEIEDIEGEDELLAPDTFGMGATGEDEESDAAEPMDDQDGTSDTSESSEESVVSPVPHPDDQASGTSDEEDTEEKAKETAFFAPESTLAKRPKSKGSLPSSFKEMSLSRPIHRGLNSVGFVEPTPIQAKTIPVALRGADVVGGAITGSGKTAAFMIPILERLLYRPKKIPTSRVAILMPTRELAVQCFNVATKLASFTDITFCQLVGGFSLREQENVLRNRPDVIIATPGRFIDHMRNSASFAVDTLEILVLDEADRMLEDGFADELNEILTTIPKSRQTMLFSATMTSSVDNLIRVGLKQPVRIMVDAQKQTVGTLVQEFVRLRPGREDKRLACLTYLCEEVYTTRCIIFFRQKKEAHRVRIIFGLFGFKAAELHGSMSQEQRIASVESFRANTVTHLLATDVASRGLDIKGVETVINYEAPQSHSIYLHRVGRTARAGRSGRACTIAAEPDRKVVKAAVKAGKAQGAKILSRVVKPEDADEWAQKIEALDEEVEEVLREEKEERQLGQVEMQVRKGENIIQHEGEIMARPKRTWFESEREKRMAKKAGRQELNGLEQEGGGTGKKKKAGKLSGKDKKRLDDTRDRKEGKVWKKGREERGMKGGKVMKKGLEKGRKGGKGTIKKKVKGKR